MGKQRRRARGILHKNLLYKNVVSGKAVGASVALGTSKIKLNVDYKLVTYQNVEVTTPLLSTLL